MRCLWTISIIICQVACKGYRNSPEAPQALVLNIISRRLRDFPPTDHLTTGGGKKKKKKEKKDKTVLLLQLSNWCQEKSSVDPGLAQECCTISGKRRSCLISPCAEGWCPSPGAIQLAAVMAAFIHMVKNNITSMETAELGGTSRPRADPRTQRHPYIQLLHSQTVAIELHRAFCPEDPDIHLGFLAAKHKPPGAGVVILNAPFCCCSLHSIC